eukprot:10339-Heterococcus_DN1.PRE.1
MERYVEKMRKRKLQSGKKTIAGQKRSSDSPANDGVSPRGGPLGPVNINSASKAIAQSAFTLQLVPNNTALPAITRVSLHHLESYRWVRLARDSLDGRFSSKSAQMRESLRALAGRMTQETDWFYGAAMRLEGQ